MKSDIWPDTRYTRYPIQEKAWYSVEHFSYTIFIWSCRRMCIQRLLANRISGWRNRISGRILDTRKGGISGTTLPDISLVVKKKLQPETVGQLYIWPDTGYPAEYQIQKKPDIRYNPTWYFSGHLEGAAARDWWFPCKPTITNKNTGHKKILALSGQSLATYFFH